MLGLVDQISMDLMITLGFSNSFFCGWWWTFLSSSGCLMPSHATAVPADPSGLRVMPSLKVSEMLKPTSSHFPWSTSSPKEGGRRFLHLPLRPQHFLSALAFCSAKLSYSLTCRETRHFASRANLYTTWAPTFICHLALLLLSYLSRYIHRSYWRMS